MYIFQTNTFAFGLHKLFIQHNPIFPLRPTTPIFTISRRYLRVRYTSTCVFKSMKKVDSHELRLCVDAHLCLGVLLTAVYFDTLIAIEAFIDIVSMPS